MHYVHLTSSSHSCIMSSTRTLDEVIEQSIELINIGSEGWIQRYMELTLLFPPENFGRKWVLYKLHTELKLLLIQISRRENWTDEDIEEANAVLNYPLNLNNIQDSIPSYRFSINIIISILFSILSGAIAFLFSK